MAGGGARGGGWQVADSEGFPLAPSRLAARGSPRLARLARVYKGFIGAVTVTGAAADAVTVAVAVRGSGEMRFRYLGPIQQVPVGSRVFQCLRCSGYSLLRVSGR